MQADNPSGEWGRDYHGRLTTSSFGGVCKQSAKYVPSTIQVLYKRSRKTAECTNEYDIVHEKEARQYLQYLITSCML